MSPGGVAGVLLDRDGVITRHREDYVKSWDEVEVLPGAADAVARLCESGYQVAVVTNQSAVGRGLMTMATLDSIHRGLDQIIRAAGGEISGYLVCPHRPDGGCDCRKPRPGMLREAGRLLGVDLAGTYMVGDRDTDVIAALSAGCRPILLQPDASASPPQRDPAMRCPTAADLAAAVDLILARANQAGSSR
jgi:D-glycero-D-manno-heptose 1,7-bisphosphate phosphatase